MSTNAQSAPEDRFCDLVMKGGITSGIVYPPAIAELAAHYRFRSIGGTSAGAIAAVVTAAAEYQRRQTGRMDGFERLSSLPDELGSKDDKGRTQLLRLFQPDRPGRRLFGVLIASLNRAGASSRVAAVGFGLLRAYWPATLFSIAVSLLAGARPSSHISGVIEAVLVLLITLPLFLGFRAYLDFTRNVVRNGYGLCKGLTTEPGFGPALTPWLHALIQSAAGRTQNEPPLTFGDLWHAKGFPSAKTQQSGQQLAGVRSIDLQMFTTSLTHGRPYILPHDEPTARLFYKTEELAQYLPEDVMRCFDKHGRQYEPSKAFPDSDPPVSEAKRLGLKEIPAPENFPVLLAARMSLSFPLLFAAVPLYAIDYERPRGSKPRTFRPCYFSDGGLSSNFPIHLFDGLLPNWPTFGIQLEPKLPERENLIFLPEDYREGFADRWTRFAEDASPATRMSGFLASLFNATQNWNDNALSRMPGVRDRVVRVRLRDSEGGINLNMPSSTISEVSQRGRQAAQALVKRFVGKPNASAKTSHGSAARAAPGWDQQRWVRLDVLAHSLSQRAAGLVSALGSSIPEATTYADLVVESQRSAPPGHSSPLSASQAKALQSLIDALSVLAAEFAQHSKDYPNSPVPEAALRVRPPL